jgi:hypothetical protein
VKKKKEQTPIGCRIPFIGRRFAIVDGLMIRKHESARLSSDPLFCGRKLQLQATGIIRHGKVDWTNFLLGTQVKIVLMRPLLHVEFDALDLIFAGYQLLHFRVIPPSLFVVEYFSGFSHRVKNDSHSSQGYALDFVLALFNVGRYRRSTVQRRKVQRSFPQSFTVD